MPGVNQRIVVLIRDDDQPAEAENLDSDDAANADDQAAEDVQ